MDDHFAHNLLVFSRLLRSVGFDTSPDQVSDLARIVQGIGVSRREDFYYSARAIFVRRQADLIPFGRAFELFFRIHDKPQKSIIDPTKKPARRVFLPKAVRPSTEHENQTGKSSRPTPEQDRPLPDKVLTYTSTDILRHKNFDEFTIEEIREARRLMGEMDWEIGERQTRRKARALNGAQIDFSRLIRSNLKHGTELFKLPERERKVKMRPLVVLADISGSMERYTRMVLHLLHALSHEMSRVEVFTFGTRLTRITPDLKKRSVEAAISRASRRVPDWSGGTRIGAALKDFNFKWARRVLRAGAVVLIISDGWDRGELELLHDEMARLQRSCFRLIWLNPLLGAPNFEPSAGGMQVALGFVDDFLPVHNVATLEALVEKLATIQPTRPLRRQNPRVVIPTIEQQHSHKTMELPQMGSSDYVRRTMVFKTIDGIPTITYQDNPSDS